MVFPSTPEGFPHKFWCSCMVVFMWCLLEFFVSDIERHKNTEIPGPHELCVIWEFSCCSEKHHNDVNKLFYQKAKSG